jgi:mannose-6-phosphate isomerase-like protein (cupin superfamily)
METHMHAMRAAVCGVLVGAVCGIGAFAQRRPIDVRQPAPTDRAVDFTLSELEATFREMDAGKLATVRLLEGGAYNVNIRRLVGAESALVHGKTTDVWVVREGSGTLVTGGTLVDGKAGANGDLSGSGIRGGVERTIKAGDVIFIPAGVPHGVRESKSITWLNIRFDTK